ncbi:MAG: deoxyguanosinetriphosphate triphosphohydrolase [bacterium]|nr:deoxyguanosinetriphosphate triphosphohydrolase [bacterium]
MNSILSQYHLSHIRKSLESGEEKNLSSFATISKRSKGRLHKDNLCDVRTIFSQDRDRIIHSKYFRRLKHKTQVFLAPINDLLRTRLTHTLEVTQIATTIARALNVNRDLTEAIALGHDLGHTPFGHIGEFILNKLSPFGFHHSIQSLRVVDKLEKPGGLNLSYEVRDGILKHSKGGKRLLPFGYPDCPETIEGEIVRVSDSIAYINHDIDDALRSHVIKTTDLPRSCVRLFGARNSQRISIMVYDIVANSEKGSHIRMGEKILHETEKLRNFLFQKVYVMPEINSESRKASKILSELYSYFMKDPDIPVQSLCSVEDKNEKKDVVIIDYLATLTDIEAIDLFKRLFEPRRWAG